MKKSDLIKIATERYGKVYNFSQVNEHDVENENNILIKCEKHGAFFETPYHITDSIIGCFECYKENVWNREV